MEESTLFFEMQLRNVVVYQKIKYTQILKLYFFQTYRNIKKYNSESEDIPYPNIFRYKETYLFMTEYDLKNLIFNIKIVQISDGNLFFHEKLNKMRFYSNFQEERESRNFEF